MSEIYLEIIRELKYDFYNYDKHIYMAYSSDFDTNETIYISDRLNTTLRKLRKEGRIENYCITSVGVGTKDGKPLTALSFCFSKDGFMDLYTIVYTF